MAMYMKETGLKIEQMDLEFSSMSTVKRSTKVIGLMTCSMEKELRPGEGLESQTLPMLGSSTKERSRAKDASNGKMALTTREASSMVSFKVLASTTSRT